MANKKSELTVKELKQRLSKMSVDEVYKLLIECQTSLIYFQSTEQVDTHPLILNSLSAFADSDSTKLFMRYCYQIPPTIRRGNFILMSNQLEIRVENLVAKLAENT